MGNVHISLAPLWTADRRHVDPVQRETFETLVTHYWANDGFPTNGNEIRRRVDEIDVELIHRGAEDRLLRDLHASKANDSGI